MQHDFFIHIPEEEVPKWDASKHWWEQDLEAIEFFTNEYNKFKEGVWLDGVYIHPWLYFHCNFFKTPIPVKDERTGIIEDKIMIPPMRDNEFYIAENLKIAQDLGKILFLFGTRRFSKSVIEASLATWASIIKGNSMVEIVGGSSQDLSMVARFMQVANTNMHPAFRLPTIKNDWEKYVSYGYKETGTLANVIHSELFIKNLVGGRTKEATEKGAGGAPVLVICDEVGKTSIIQFIEGLKPAMATPEGLKGIIILSGTGGNAELSKDAERMLKDPEAFGILPMQYQLLEDRIKDKSDITWTRKTFGTFVPAQMAYEAGVIKLPSNLSEYLDIHSEKLAKIKINVTDWKNAKEIYYGLRKAKEKEKDVLAKEIMYHPLDPDECFMGGINNPYPAQVARLHLNQIREDGTIGKDVEIYKENTGLLGYTLSNKTRVKFPFEGGIHNSPVIIFEDPENDGDNIPVRYKYVAGLDPYKSVQSGTDSVGSTYILKRRVDLETPIERIVASYSSRPTTFKIFHRTLENLYEGYNSECFMENADQGFLQYLEDKGKAEMILANGVDFSRMLSPKANPRTKFGFSPTPRTLEYLHTLAINYCWEEVVVGQDELGNNIVKLGVEFIDDPDLLEEIISYKPGGNFDRLRAFSAALAWARYLDKLHILPAQPSNLEKDSRAREKRKKQAKLAASGFVKPLKR